MKFLAFLCVVGVAFAVREPEVKTCLDEPDGGRCLAYFPMFYYDPQTGTCKQFIYGGCGGNGNRYATEEDCLEQCKGVRVKQGASGVCSLKKDRGMCLAYMLRFWYNQETGKCEEFVYGGCQGNGNNFKKVEECEATCGATQAALDRPDCDKGPETGRCKAMIHRYYYDQQEGLCKAFVYGGCGGNRNNFQTVDECYNKCGALRTVSACEQEKVVGPCKAAVKRFYFNKVTGECEDFIYGGCRGNDNNFEKQEDCEAVCAPRTSAKCSLEPETGLCRGYFPKFFYDPKTGTCQKFIYGGCGGNANNFKTESECLRDCSSA